jgi:hypothetical protein
MGKPHTRLLRALSLGALVAFSNLNLNAQTPKQTIPWNPLLGPSTTGQEVKSTPEYGIRYQANGFDRPKLKRIMIKSPRYLNKKGAAHLVESFQDFALEMTNDKDVVPRWIDEAWREIKDRWNECGGVYAETARSIDPRSIHIIVEDRPFWMPQYQFYANGTTDGTTIRVVNVTAARLFTYPEQAYLVRLPELLKWEIGNTFQARAFGYPGSVAAEIGAASPCGR